MRGVLLVAVVIAAALAGCADGEDLPVQEAAPPAPVEAAPTNITGESPFGWDLAIGVPFLGIDAQNNANNGVTVSVPEGAKRLTINATWTCGGGLCGLHLYLDRDGRSSGGLGPFAIAPTGRGAEGHTTGDGEASFVVDEPAMGDWSVVVHSDGPYNEQLSGTFAWEVLLPGAELPELAPDEHDHGTS